MSKKLLLPGFVLVSLLAVSATQLFVITASYGEATIIMGTTDSIESAVDPAQAFDYFGWEIIQNTGCGLVETEPGTGDVVPSLALNWEVSGNGLTWNFTLRQGVKFDDNTELNATHVKYSFDRSMGIASPDGPQLNMGYDAIIDSVEVVSKYVVRFNLKIPFAPFLRLMACPASFIVNPEYAPVDQIVYYTEGDARASSPMDLGPYLLTNWTRVAGKDTEMWLEANPNYWRSGYPKTEKIIIKFYTHTPALRLAVEAGDVDVAFRHLSPVDLEDLQDNSDLKIWQGAGGAIQYMVFQEAIPPLNDSRVRKAIAAALDRPTMCSTVFLDQTSPLYSIIPEGMMGHTEAFAALGNANYSYTQNTLNDPTIYGGPYNTTNKLQIDLWYETSGHYPSSEEQALIYKSSLEASGVIEVTLKSADWPSYRLNRNDGIMEVFLYGWYPDYIDPDNYAFLYYAAWLNHGYSTFGEHYTEMKAAYDAARATTDEAERVALYAEIDDYAVMDCPVVPLWQGKAWAVTKLAIKGVHLDITQTWRMWYLYVCVHDIGIGSIAVSKTVVGQDYSLQINVTISNYGNNTENFNATIYANTTIVHTFSNITLTARTSVVVACVWNTTGFAKGNYNIKAIADSVPEEIDTSDNTLTDGWVFITIPGDFQGDRDVDIYDIVMMAGIYGVSEPDPRYNATCDIDDDGDVDIYDVVIAAANYGESW